MGAAEALGGACEDRLRGPERIVAHVAVPHPKHGPAFAPKPLIASHIALGFGMLAAVDLDHQLCVTAGEVDHIRPDRQLPRELGPIAGQELSDLSLFRRGVRAQRPGAFGNFDFQAPGHFAGLAQARFAHPPLAPPFQGGG